MEKRLKTIMIGAISIFETEFKEELKNKNFYEKFLEARKQILDLGNHQIRLEKGDRK